MPPTLKQLPSRKLSLPESILNLQSLSEGDERGQFAEIAHVVVLETFCLFISSGEMYKVPLGPGPCPAPELVQSYVLNACPIDAAHGQGGAGDRAFVLTAEYSLLFCEPSSQKGSLLEFSEVAESMLLEEEMELVAAEPALVFADLHRGLAVVVTQLRVLVLSIRLLENGSLHVLGSSRINISLQAIPFKMEEEGKENIEMAMQFAAEAYVSVIERAAIWGGSDTTAAIACSGNGRWVHLLPLLQDSQEGVWRLLQEDTKKEGMEKENPTRRGEFYPLEVKQHRSWITALSTGSRTSLCVSGDASGGLLLWGPHARGQKFEKLAYVADFCHSCAVSLISADISGNVWVADSSGMLACALYSDSSRALERIRTVKLFTSCEIASLQWRDSSDADDTRGRLRATSAAGTAVECRLHDSLSVILSTPAEPCYLKGHSSAIEVCALLSELELVITAGCGDKAWVWDLSTCRLLTTITSKDRFCTAICTYDSGFVPGGHARILMGHSNGHTHEYVLIYDRNKERDQAAGEGVELRKGSLSVLPLSEPSVRSRSPRNKVLSAVSDSLDLISGQNLHQDEDQNEPHPAAPASVPSAKEEVVEEEGGEEQARVEGAESKAAGAICKVEFHSSSEYLPLPVTQILTSALGFHHVFCYAQSIIVIHSWEDGRALAQIQFDESLVEISSLSSVEDEEDLEGDSFTLVLQGQHNVKLLDAIRGKMLTSFDVGTPETSIVTSAMWDLPVPTTDVAGSRRIIGFAATSGPAAFVFGDMSGCIPVPLEPAPAAATTTASTLVGRLVLGCRSFGLGCSPFASIWTVRSVYWLRFNLHDALPEVLRVQEYTVPHDKVRVVLAQAVKTRLLANRVLVVLSDGTLAIYTL